MHIRCIIDILKVCLALDTTIVGDITSHQAGIRKLKFRKMVYNTCNIMFIVRKHVLEVPDDFLWQWRKWPRFTKI
jgi:hypothetical protein